MKNMINLNLRKNTDNSTLTLGILIAAVFVLMAILSPNEFYSWANVRSMLFQFPEFGIIAFGVMVCMISGGIDLSLVGLANLAGIICAYIMLGMGNTDLSIAIGIAAGIGVGIAGGAFNGFLISVLKLPPMLVTLCGLELFQGLGLGLTKGPAVRGLPDNFKFIANGSITFGGIEIPIVLFIFIGVLAIVLFIMRNTVFGHHVYFMGSNKEAAKYSGINCHKTTMLTYMMSGLMGAIAGIVMTSHLNSAKSDSGTTYTLLSILIVVLGGVHPDGGRGRVLGVTLSVLLLQFITQTFTIMKIDTNWKTFTYGMLLILALVIATIQTKIADRRAQREPVGKAEIKLKNKKEQRA